MSEDVTHKSEILHTRRRRLRQLEKQAALYGEKDCPPHITLEIEDLRREISELESSQGLEVLPEDKEIHSLPQNIKQSSARRLWRALGIVVTLITLITLLALFPLNGDPGIREPRAYTPDTTNISAPRSLPTLASGLDSPAVLSPTIATQIQTSTVISSDSQKCIEPDGSETTLDRPTNRIESVAFSSTGGALASLSLSTVKLWKVQNGTFILTATLTHISNATSLGQHVSFSWDGEKLASTSADPSKALMLWRVTDGQSLDVFNKIGASQHDSVNTVAFAPDDKTIALGLNKGGGNNAPLLIVSTVDGSRVNTLYEQQEPVYSVAFSKDGILASASKDKIVNLWDLSTDPPRIQSTIPFTDEVHNVAFSPNGTILATALWSTPSSPIYLWRVADTKQPLYQLTGHDGPVTSLAFAPSNSNILASASADKTVLLWDVASERAVAKLCFRVPVLSVAFSADGQSLAVGIGTDDPGVPSQSQLLIWHFDKIIQRSRM